MKILMVALVAAPVLVSNSYMDDDKNHHSYWESYVAPLI